MNNSRFQIGSREKRLYKVVCKKTSALSVRMLKIGLWKLVYGLWKLLKNNEK